jgi:hypothetical protein
MAVARGRDIKRQRCDVVGAGRLDALAGYVERTRP